MGKPVKIAITGAGGQVAYQLLFRIASGDMLGKDQPVILHLLDLPTVEPVVKGVMMELEDCSFPLLEGMQFSAEPTIAFRDVDFALLVGARPRTQGMERKELLAHNAQIFVAQGKALNEVASRHVKVLVVGNPANTNAYIAMKSAPGLPHENFTAMMRLDHNRALTQLAFKINQPISSIEKICVWGNHGPTMYADYRFATAQGQLLTALIHDKAWNEQVFLPTVAQRGSAVIQMRGASSAGSAANAAIDHMRDWVLGTHGRWVTMGIPSDGSYGIPKDLICGLPVTTALGQYHLVQGLPLDNFSQERIKHSIKELEEERQAIAVLLGWWTPPLLFVLTVWLSH